MLAVGHEGVTMAPGQLLFTRVPIIDKQEKSAALVQDCGDSIYPRKRQQRRLDALTLFRMNSITIEKFVLFSRRRNEALDKLPIRVSNPYGAAMIDHLDRQGVEKFVTENNGIVGASRSCCLLERIKNRALLCSDVFRQTLLQLRPKIRRLFNKRVSQRPKEFRKRLR